MDDIGDEDYMHLLIICDFDHKDSNNVSFYYPAYTQELKKIDQYKMKDFIINQIVQKIKTISMFKSF